MLTIMEKVDLLLNAPIFARVPTESLARLAALAREVHFDAQAILFSEYDPPRELYFLLDGEVSLSGPARSGDRLERHRVAGALAVLGDQPHRETARAVQPAWTLCISQQDLFDAMAEECAICRGILQTLAGLLAQGKGKEGTTIDGK